MRAHSTVNNRIPVIRLIDGESPRLLHGADYNPDQWLDSPAILNEDIRLMQLARVNVVSLGIFSWVALEPEEDRFTFDWLDETIERLWNAEVFVFLATPTGARPTWMSQTYPEVLRVQANRVRNLHGGRHNHCQTSPVYRERTRIINTRLAERYGGHPAVRLWHLSNEYRGECHCPLCQQAFRAWLEERYAGDLDALNKAWWTSFWSHTFTNWDQIESPAPHGEPHVHGLNLDWKRFVTYQTRDFMRAEIAAIRAVSPDIPVTTNLMGFFPGIDYFKIGADLDVVSWDSYPTWGGFGSDTGSQMEIDFQAGDWRLASIIGTAHDLMRCCGGGKPFLLMESTPSMTNWTPVAKKKRPGVHLASSLLAVAHGSDSVQYFQWRKSRGSVEKLHGAVIDHVGHEHTRVFADVADVGDALDALGEIAGTTYPADIAVIFDWENKWALEDAKGPRNDDRLLYTETVERHHHALTRFSAQVDVIDSGRPFDRYKILIAPMLYMIKPGVAERIVDFVRSGGTFVATYWTGIVNESDLCFTSGFPGPLADVLGIWSEETDALYPPETNTVRMHAPFTGARTSGAREYQARDLCDLIHLRGAESLAEYGDDFYAGRPALTRNAHGDGQAYYIASRNEECFLGDFYAALVETIRPTRAYDEELPESVHATLRHAANDDGTVTEYRFLINFDSDPARVPPPADGEAVIYRSPSPNTGAADRPATGASHSDTRLPGYGVQVRRFHGPHPRTG
ncbi:MAG: beta-galactosidase [Spirochaetales bacterium]|nr:beta-galactosidase [Spirochaetales bacterium]